MRGGCGGCGRACRSPERRDGPDAAGARRSPERGDGPDAAGACRSPERGDILWSAAGSAASGVLPVYWPENTTIRPFFDICTEPRADGVQTNITALLIQLLTGPELSIPGVVLPQPLQSRFLLTCEPLPVTRPLANRLRAQDTGYTKQMDVVRHDHVLSHTPLRGILPRVEQCGVRLLVVIVRTAITGTDRHKYNSWLIETVHRWRMGQTFAFECVHVGE